MVVIREYRVEGLARRGERSDSEDDAVQRLRALRHEAELAERRATAVPPKVSLPAGDSFEWGTERELPARWM